MKKLIYLLLLSPIIYLTSCSSVSDLSPTTSSLHGTWQYDAWIIDSVDDGLLMFGGINYLNICEDSAYWEIQSFDNMGKMTDYNRFGTFNINDDQTEAIFTLTHYYAVEPTQIGGSWIILEFPQSILVSINKLNELELDLSFSSNENDNGDGGTVLGTQIIETIKTPTEPICIWTEQKRKK